MEEQRERMDEELVKQHEIWERRRDRQLQRQAPVAAEEVEVGAQGEVGSSNKSNNNNRLSLNMHTDVDEMGHFADQTATSKTHEDKQDKDKRTSRRLEAEHKKWEERQRKGLLHTESELFSESVGGWVTSLVGELVGCFFSLDLILHIRSINFTI